MCEKITPRIKDMWKKETPEKWKEEEDKPLTMETLAIVSRRFPSPTRRFCTTRLKMEPLKRYLDSREENLVVVSGVRGEESPARAGQSRWMFDTFMEKWRWLPIHEWSADQVFTCHRRHDIPPNPLYKKGMSRVGCWPCIMWRKEELKNLALNFPESYEDLIKMESRVAKTLDKDYSTFFPPKKVSKKYRRQVGDTEIATAKDVRDWALGSLGPSEDGEPLGGGEDLQSPACSSVYGLYE